MAVRGSPAKGVDWGDWCEGSNPSFSATKEHSYECSFDIHPDPKESEFRRNILFVIRFGTQ